MENIREKHNVRRMITATKESLFSEHEKTLPYLKILEITDSSFIMAVTFFDVQ